MSTLTPPWVIPTQAYPGICRAAVSRAIRRVLEHHGVHSAKLQKPHSHNAASCKAQALDLALLGRFGPLYP